MQTRAFVRVHGDNAGRTRWLVPEAVIASMLLLLNHLGAQRQRSRRLRRR